MKSLKGIENPAFVASSPDTPRRVCASSPSIEISVLPTPAAGSPPPPAPQEPPERPEPPQPSGVPGASGPGSLSEYEEGPCGWGSFQPRALQRCNTPRGFLFHYCLLALTQGEDGRRLRRAVGERGAVEGRRGAPGRRVGAAGAPPAPGVTGSAPPRGVVPGSGLASARTDATQPGSRFCIFSFSYSETLKTCQASSFSSKCSTSSLAVSCREGGNEGSPPSGTGCSRWGGVGERLCFTKACILLKKKKKRKREVLKGFVFTSLLEESG